MMTTIKSLTRAAAIGCLSAATLVGAVLLPAAPATAAGRVELPAGVKIVDPTPDSVVQPGEHIATLDFTDAVDSCFPDEVDPDVMNCNEFAYGMSINCRGQDGLPVGGDPWAYGMSQLIPIPGKTGRDAYTYEIPYTAVEGSRCQIEAQLTDRENNFYVTRAQFTVYSPTAPATPRNPFVSHAGNYAAFYPLVRDGYRDSTVTTFKLNQAANVTYEVLDRNGKVIRARNAGYLVDDRAHRFAWAGKDNAQRVVAPGKYTMRVTAENMFGDVYRQTRTVKVATGVKWERSRSTVNGLNRNGFNRRACQIADGPRQRMTKVFCRGGKAVVRYVLPVPARSGAIIPKVTHTSVGGKRPGKVFVTGKRIAPKKYVVWVTVTNKRWEYLRQVSVSYKHRRTI